MHLAMKEIRQAIAACQEIRDLNQVIAYSSSWFYLSFKSFYKDFFCFKLLFLCLGISLS